MAGSIDWNQDPVLADMIAYATADPDCAGLLLSGSRGAGVGDPDSDYDPIWVLTEDALIRRRERGESVDPDYHPPDGVEVERWATSPSGLAAIAAKGDWLVPGVAYAAVLLDKTGEVAAALEALATLPEEKAKADTAAYLDGYLNAFYRSMKAARRGHELGARLEAAESVMLLVRTLYALERRWPPYHDRVELWLAVLDAQGWPPGYLRETLLGLLREPEPRRQVELEIRVEALLRARGFGHVFDAWGGNIEGVKARYVQRVG